jgi:tripeptide aminopeptidase
MMQQPPIRLDRLLERFLRYVAIDTTADPAANSYPSSGGQLELGRLLLHELRRMGLDDIEHDEHGLVWATIPATVAGDAPTILFNAHLDTSPEAPGYGIRPQVIDVYQGGDIVVGNAGKSIRASECGELAGLVGHCLVTTDGTTLLGGDDKAGVAAIMELAEHLVEHPRLPHGPVRILFTCDEEIGRGAKHFTVEKGGAAAGYTLDGSGHDEVEAENFSADSLTIHVEGHNIHPAIAQGKMVNAATALSRMISLFPRDRQTPETTAGRDGFLHVYQINGGVGEASARVLLRDFDTPQLDRYEALVLEAARRVEGETPGLKINVQRQMQYRNMADSLGKHPHVVENAVKAHQRRNRTATLGAIRGGTDGAVFSSMGLPTPNLSVGQHNIHSVLEFASITEMAWAIEHAIELLGVWQSGGQAKGAGNQGTGNQGAGYNGE